MTDHNFELNLLKKEISDMDDMITLKIWVNELKSKEERINNESDIQKLKLHLENLKMIYQNLESKQYLEEIKQDFKR